ncbi:MAG TPA: helix-turn-helix transcriptional regulator [Bacteroidia bacterium]|nr:helix-turn-helix transcriptional regulator [Bacteroidia bacterium]
MDSQFGSKIRTLREGQKLYLRQVASLLDMDTAQLSKIEKDFRQMKKEQIAVIANIYKIDKAELVTLWLADQIVEVVKDSKTALQAISVAENQLKFRKSNNKLSKN